MARKKTMIEFNPDVMTVSDLKSCASTLRSIFQKYHNLQNCDMNEDEILSELGLTILQYVDAYEV